MILRIYFATFVFCLLPYEDGCERNDRLNSLTISRNSTHGLRCFKCNQRVQNVTVCKNATVEDCSTVFPQTDSVCLKTVQRFSTGQPPWVFGQCQIRAAFQPDQLGACRISSAGSNISSASSNVTDTLETCTCLTDLCNDQAKLIPVPVFLIAISLIHVLPLIFSCAL